MIQDKMIELQKAYFESSMKIICLQALETNIYNKAFDIKQQKVNKQKFELSYNALHKELKRLGSIKC